MISLPVSPEPGTHSIMDQSKLWSPLPTDGASGVAGRVSEQPVILVEEESVGDSESELQRGDTVSMSSRDSSVYAGPQNLLYTDSEDNRSASNRSSHMGDSGICWKREKSFKNVDIVN